MAICFLEEKYPHLKICRHGRRKDFFGGTLGDFSNIFLGGTKSGEISVFPHETKKQRFFAEIFKIYEGAKAPLSPLPTPMSADNLLCKIIVYDNISAYCCQRNAFLTVAVTWGIFFMV